MATIWIQLVFFFFMFVGAVTCLGGSIEVAIIQVVACEFPRIWKAVSGRSLSQCPLVPAALITNKKETLSEKSSTLDLLDQDWKIAGK